MFTIEDVEPPVGINNQPIPLPDNSNYPRVVDNILTTLKKHNPKFASSSVVSTWTRHFKSPECRAVLSDMFWYSLVKIDNRPNLKEYKKSLLERISYNYIQVFVNVPMQEKEIFFENFFDCIAQGVFYSMFFSYPKSRFRLNSEEFKSRLYEIVSKKVTGISVKNQGFNNWVLELGAGNVLKRHSVSQGGPRTSERFPSMKVKKQSRQTLQQLRYSPLVSRYLHSKRYEAINSVPTWNMRYTTRNIQKEKETEKKHAYYKKLAIDTEKQSKDRDKQFLETSFKIDEKIKEEHKKYRLFVNRITGETKQVIRDGPSDLAKKLVSFDALLGPDKKSGYISLSKLK